MRVECRERGQHAIYTRDHVLDLEIGPDRTASRKDDDELEVAVAQGRFDAAAARMIEANAAEVEAIVADYHQQNLHKNPYGYCPIHATGVKYADA